MAEGPRIYAFLDYRAYLAACFDYRKQQDPEFSLRTFASDPLLGLSSSSFISAVLKGRKNLSQNLRLRFGRALGLEPAELAYFELLVQGNQSQSADEKSHYEAQMARFHNARARELGEGQQRFYARWYYRVVWHFIGLRQDINSPARIAKSIFPPLTPAQAEEAIQVLLELRLIKRLANGYALNDRHLAAGQGFGGAAAREHHRGFLKLAEESLDRAPEPERRYSVTSFSISPRGRERVQERIEALRAEVRELAEADEGGLGGDRVYALTLHLFPCSREQEAEGGVGPVVIRSGRPPARARAGTSADAGNPRE
ncbi:MAG: TIGR02147 family protein [Fibrobacteria bacterium]